MRCDLALCGVCAARFERSFADDLPSWSEPYPCVSCGRAVRFNIARQRFIPRYVTCSAFDCRRAAKIVAQRERRGRVHDLTHDCRCHWCCKPFMPTRTDALYCFLALPAARLSAAPARGGAAVDRARCSCEIRRVKAR